MSDRKPKQKKDLTTNDCDAASTNVGELAQSSRRMFLMQSLGILTAPALGFMPTAASANSRDFLIAFAETLLPGHHFKSAADVGSSSRILERAAEDPVFADLLNQAIAAINAGTEQRLGTNFAEAVPEGRHQIFAALDTIPETDLVGWFFRAARAEIFFHYYAQPGAEQTVQLSGPPQPYGYDDIDKPWQPT